MSVVDYVYYRTPAYNGWHKSSAFIGLTKNPDFKMDWKNCKERVFPKAEFEEFFKNKQFKQLLVGFADNDDLEYFVPVISYRAQNLSLGFNAYRKFDLSPLENLRGIEAVELNWNLKIDRLWDIKKNPDLKRFEITDYNKVTDFSVFEGSNVEHLELHGCNGLSSFTNKLHVKNISFLTRMPMLKTLRLYIAKDESDETYLKTLASLKNLEELHVDEGFFTFEQFAWLSAHLPDTEGLDFAWYFESLKTYSIIGRRKPRFLNDETRLEKYRVQYEKLKEKFKDQKEPPLA